MTQHSTTTRTTLVFLMLLLWSPLAWALPVTGYLEATAANGWQGTYAVRLADGTVATGTQTLSWAYVGGAGLSSLQLMTTGCVMSSSCIRGSDGITMTQTAVNITGSANLGSLGTLSWGSQLLRLLPGAPSPTVAVLGDTYGVLGGTTLVDDRTGFGFDTTLTSYFSAAPGGQALTAIRIDFSDGVAPPERHDAITNWQVNTSWINMGVPVAMGTPLVSDTPFAREIGTIPGPASIPGPTAVPEPSILLLLGGGLVGLGGVAWKRKPRTERKDETPLPPYTRELLSRWRHGI